MSMTRDIAEYIDAAGIAVLGENLFIGTLPDLPDLAAGVFQYAGRTPDPIAGISRPGLQIRVRGTTYAEAEELSEDICLLLEQIGDEANETLAEGAVIGGSLYLRIAPVQSPFPLGEDESERVEFAQNFNVDLRRK